PPPVESTDQCDARWRPLAIPRNRTSRLKGAASRLTEYRRGRADVDSGNNPAAYAVASRLRGSTRSDGKGYASPVPPGRRPGADHPLRRPPRPPVPAPRSPG